MERGDGMTVPKLRFKADDGTEFPDWEGKKLGDNEVTNHSTRDTVCQTERKAVNR